MPLLNLSRCKLPLPCTLYIGDTRNVPAEWDRKIFKFSDLDSLPLSAEGAHSLVVVPPVDVSFALRILEEAFQAAPLLTSSTIVVPLQCALKRNWTQHLKQYKLLDRVKDNYNKWHLVMHRGKRSRNSQICTVHASGHVDSRPSGIDKERDKPALFDDLYCTFHSDSGGGRTVVLADTGSQIHVTTVAYARKVGKPFGPPVCDAIGGVGGAAGSLGSIEIDLAFRGGIFPILCDIVPSLPGNLGIIVGQPLLKSHDACIQFKMDTLNLTMTKDGKQYTMSRPYAKDKTDKHLTKAHMKKAHKQGLLGRVLITLGRTQISDRTAAANAICDAILNPMSMVVQRVFEEQTDINPALKEILEQESSIWESSSGLSDREYQATIDLLPGATPRMMRGYRLTPKERAELVEQIKKMIAKGWIRPSASSWGAPVLFAPKSDGGLRMCIDYRMLNASTVRNAYPLPNIQDALDGFAGATVFSTLDLAAGFHQIVLDENSRHLTAFRTDQGLYEYNVMPMGLANAPAMFQKAMNDTLRPFMNRFVTVYMDDIIIYSKTMEEHASHLKQVLQVMALSGWKCRRDKCCFGVSSVVFLGHVVSGSGLAVDPAKVKVVNDWKSPQNVGDVRSFVGLVQYFKRFVKDLSTILVPLTDLTKKNATFYWNDKCEASFQEVKALLSTAPVLGMPDPALRYSVYTDASIYGCGGVLMQEGKPVAYCGRKFDKTMTNWTTTEQELYGLVYAMETWRCYLEGVKFDLYTDHQSLVWLKTQTTLTRKQSRWLLYLQRFDMDLKYVPGPKNPADAISRASHLEGEHLPSVSEVEFDHVMSDLDEKRSNLVLALTVMTGQSENVVTPWVFTAQTQPGHRSARLRAKEGGNSQYTNDLPHSDPRVPKPVTQDPYRDMTVDRLINLRNLARGGFIPSQLNKTRVREPQSADAEPDHDPLFSDTEMEMEEPVLPPDTQHLNVSPSVLEEASEQVSDVNHTPVEDTETLSQQVEHRRTGDMAIDVFLNTVIEGYMQDKWFGKPENMAKVTRVKEFLFKEHALALPDHGGVRQAALYQMHDAPWAGHVGRERTKWALKQSYWWPGMDADIDQYVKTCGPCQRNKARHRNAETLMAPLAVPERAFEQIGADFVMFLPVSRNGFDAICVFSCHFTKMVHLVPCHSTITSKEFADLFRRHIFRLHGLPRSIVSDRGVQFVSGMWAQLSEDLGIKLNMSTAHRPQSDGQVERANKTIEEMLRAYVNTSHNDWCQWLDCAEFAINKAKAAATGVCPFQLVFQHTPMSPPERMLHNSLNPISQSDKYGKQHYRSRRLGRAAGEDWWLRLRNARTALHQAKDRMKQMADKNRTDRSLEIGDFALLSTKHLRLKKPSVAKKFCPVFVGPFEVIERIGRSAYRLRLPENCTMHNVIHVSKLWKYNKAPGDGSDLRQPLWLESDELPEISDILRVRGKEDKKYYLVQYKNKDCMYCTWEPEKTLKLTCSELISHFKSRRSEREPGALSFVLLKESLPLVTDQPTDSYDNNICYSRPDNHPGLELLYLRNIPTQTFFAPKYVNWKATR